jgi:hypothetical protein
MGYLTFLLCACNGLENKEVTGSSEEEVEANNSKGRWWRIVTSWWKLSTVKRRWRLTTVNSNDSEEEVEADDSEEEVEANDSEEEVEVDDSKEAVEADDSEEEVEANDSEEEVEVDDSEDYNLTSTEQEVKDMGYEHDDTLNYRTYV